MGLGEEDGLTRACGHVPEEAEALGAAVWAALWPGPYSAVPLDGLEATGTMLPAAQVGLISHRQ